MSAPVCTGCGMLYPHHVLDSVRCRQAQFVTAMEERGWEVVGVHAFGRATLNTLLCARENSDPALAGLPHEYGPWLATRTRSVAVPVWVCIVVENFCLDDVRGLMGLLLSDPELQAAVTAAEKLEPTSGAELLDEAYRAWCQRRQQAGEE